MTVKTTEEETRRTNGIRFLAKANPKKYAARYMQGRLELFENILYGHEGKWIREAWSKVHT